MTEFIALDARINTAQWDKAIAQMEADAARVDKLFATPFVVKLKAEDSGLRSVQRALNEIDAGVTSEVKFTQTGDDIIRLRELLDDDLAADVKFTRTGDDIAALRADWDTDIAADVKVTLTGDDITNIAEGVDDVTFKVKAEEDSSVSTTLAGIEGQLEDLKALATINLVLNAATFVKDMADIPLIGQLVEIEELSHRVMGQTGRDLENVGRTINNVWTGNWGDSKEEIADVVTTVAQIRDTSGDFLIEAGNIEDVTVGAFQAAAVGGADALEVLRAASQMVKNDFTPNFEEAFDIIAQGYSEGFNQSGDFLDTLIEYSTTYSQLGLSANGFFNIMKTGTESGVFNTDKMADAFKEMLNLTKEEVSIMQTVGDETDRTRALAEAGLMDEATAYAAGELTGDEFSQAVIDTLVAQFEDPATQQRLGKAIFSPTMVEDAGLPNILQTDMLETNIWAGQAKMLSDEIFSGPGSAFQTMQRTLETHFLNALMNSVEAQDFMDRITIAAQRFGTELAKGVSIGEALEIALEIPGLADTLHQLESAFGNIAIVLLEVAASIGETFGLEVGGLKEDIARFAEGQFVFDIQTAETPEELAARMTSAINRGVEESNLADLVGQSVTERLAQGDIAGARDLVTAMGQVTDISQISDNLSGLARDLLSRHDPIEAARLLQEASNNILHTEQERSQFAQEAAELLSLPTFDTGQLDAQIQAFTDDLFVQFQAAVSAGDLGLAQTLGEQLGFANIEQFIKEQEATAVLNALFPKPTDAEIQAWFNQNYGNLATALAEGNIDQAGGIAQNLLNLDDPYQQQAIQDLVGDFATDLLFAFDDALAVGDVGAAESIMDVLGLGPAQNETILQTMREQLAAFAQDAGYNLSVVEQDFTDLGLKADETGKKGSDNMSNFYNAILSDKGALGQVDKIIKGFKGIAESVKEALDAIGDAEKKAAGGVSGKQVGGVGSAGVTMVGEGGREMVFSDERFAVLNNQTTERLMHALTGMAGGTTNHYGGNRTANVTNIITVQNDAQAALVAGLNLNQLRGEAY